MAKRRTRRRRSGGGLLTNVLKYFGISSPAVIILILNYLGFATPTPTARELRPNYGRPLPAPEIELERAETAMYLAETAVKLFDEHVGRSPNEPLGPPAPLGPPGPRSASAGEVVVRFHDERREPLPGERPVETVATRRDGWDEVPVLPAPFFRR